ncbi:DnaD domain protein [Fuchsiella alkaliacetigena]|uniref:DnaD domain protein n=1 Tax=Fuchsiella alkaliacetigena TaxID=957042 RepID=UPI00200B7079|nr:DnaD domain protein [Fuchsiella alkaliacetigena]MCK8824117.1 DnaD domain protein [Fuchsiella alkaliacetigena]
MLEDMFNPNFIKAKKSTSGSFQIQERILADTQLNSTQKLVYIALLSLSSAEYLSYEELARRASSSQQEVIEAIGILIEKGYLKLKKPQDAQLKKELPQLHIVDLEYLRVFRKYAQKENHPQLINRITDFTKPLPSPRELLGLLPKNKEKTSQNEEEISWEDINKIYFKTFSTMMNSIIKDDIEAYINEGGMDKELIIFALKESALANAKNFKYTKKMLDDWQSQDITSIAEAKQAKEDYNQQSEEEMDLAPSSYDDPEVDEILRKIIK